MTTSNEGGSSRERSLGGTRAILKHEEELSFLQAQIDIDKTTNMSKLFHAYKGNIIGLFFILPLFLYFAYEGIVHSNYLLAVGSMAAWLFIVLFAMNYWFQAVILFAGALIALYFKYWVAGIILLALSLYMINATKFIDRGEMKNLGELREKLPLVEQIINFLKDKKKI